MLQTNLGAGKGGPGEKEPREALRKAHLTKPRCTWTSTAAATQGRTLLEEARSHPAGTSAMAEASRRESRNVRERGTDKLVDPTRPKPNWRCGSGLGRAQLLGLDCTN